MLLEFKKWLENFMDQEVPYKKERLSCHKKKKFKSPRPEKMPEPNTFDRSETGFVAH